jgi:uncharacterized protein
MANEMLLLAFEPHAEWARVLLPETVCGDASHDALHLARVFANARAIAAHEGGDIELLAVATLLHDCVQLEKNSPLRAKASRLAAEKATRLLAPHWPEARLAALAHAIEAHSYSAGIPPRSLEACILQDADRLDSLGAVGVARTFFVAGRLGRSLYDPEDPRAERRGLDDHAYAIDHFRTKLLHLAAGVRTPTGARLAQARQARLMRFLAEFEEEIGLAAHGLRGPPHP